MAKKRNLKQLRKDAGLTQEQAASKLGVSHDTIGRWESGSTIPSATQAALICQTYGVQFQDVKWELKHEK